jgi:tRNA A-37 threonylcarbamoyl transferase component Bud32
VESENMNMNEQQHCPQCGAPFGGEGVGGLCPKCVAKMALGSKVRYFGDYELLEEIGRGGMGVVFKARQVSLNRHVAIKMLLQGGLATEEFVHRFRTEAEAAARLQHPNIVAIHEVGEIEGLHYFSMDYVEGPNLAALTREGALEPERAVRYVQIIAEAVHYAHQQGILHRDLKPANVLINASDQPRITDFGLAKRLDGNGGMTMSGQVLGAPSYMPPEQAGGHRGQVGVPSDVYALGAILYHLLTGRPPFAGETIAEVLSKVQTAEPQPPRELNPEVPAELEAICLKCLNKRPQDRYGSAAELAEDLRRWREGERVLARRAGAVGWWCRKHPWLLAAICLLLLLAPLACLWLSRPEPQPPDTEKDGPADEMEEAASDGVTNAALPSTTYVTNVVTNVVFLTVTQGVNVVTERREVVTTDIIPASTLRWALPPAQPQPFRRDPDLVAYYPFQGNALDYSGYGNHGNIYGAFFTNGITGAGCHFSGAQFIRVPKSPSLDITGSLTLSIWVRADQIYAHHCLLDKDQGFKGYRAGVANGSFVFAINMAKGIPAGTVPVGQWTHVTAVLNGKQMLTYINGKLVRQWTKPKKGLMVSNSDLFLGCGWHGQPPTVHPSFRGTLDEVRIYRRALSPSQVQALYLAK